MRSEIAIFDGIPRCMTSPLEGGREKFRDEPLVVRPKFFRVNTFVTLAVEVVGVERLYGRQEFFVVFVAKVLVCTFTVPGVEAMIPDHSKTLRRKRALILENVVEVLELKLEY